MPTTDCISSRSIVIFHIPNKFFLKKNKDVIQLADLLGHGSVDTTRIYLQKSYDEQKKDFNRNVTW